MRLEDFLDEALAPLYGRAALPEIIVERAKLVRYAEASLREDKAKAPLREKPATELLTPRLRCVICGCVTSPTKRQEPPGLSVATRRLSTRAPASLSCLRTEWGA